MNDWKLVVAALEEIVGAAAVGLSLPDRAGLFAGARIMLEDLKKMVREELGGDTYALEKLSGAKWHISAALGFDIDNGHSIEQHQSWAYGALSTFSNVISSRARIS